MTYQMVSVAGGTVAHAAPHALYPSSAFAGAEDEVRFGK
jgi:hypothetical protein